MPPTISPEARRTLRLCARRYETAAFLDGDPSWFMHQVEGDANREAMAFVASCLSFGSRPLFMCKLRGLMAAAEGDMDSWIRKGRFGKTLPPGSSACFYRFFTQGRLHEFLSDYRRLLDECGTLGEYVRREASGDGFEAVKAICRRFGAEKKAPVVPQDVKSACKRVCMFLRWMVRSGSPVDIGLWKGFIDKRTLIVPLDTHVMRQATRLGLIGGGAASMSAARRLTAALAEVFPDDPLRGDFALFGYGVNGGKAKDGAK